MKNNKLIALITILALTGVGCSKKSSNTDVAPIATAGAAGVVPGVPVGQIGTPTVAYGSGATVDFVPASFEEYNSFVATHPLNAPTNFKVNVNMRDMGGGRYAGKLMLSYDDVGRHYSPVFETGESLNQDLDYGTYNNYPEYAYNIWFTHQGRKAFSAYFQDSYGAVVLVIDNYVDAGDAQGGGLVTGSIWYKNFATSFATQGPARKCWFITLGPYQCGTAPIYNKSALYPADGYRKLGTFGGMNKSQAFNQ